MSAAAVWRRVSSTGFLPRFDGDSMTVLADLGLGGEETIWPGQIMEIPTGLTVDVPKGHALTVTIARSLAARGAMIPDSLMLPAGGQVDLSPFVLFAPASGAPLKIRHGDPVARLFLTETKNFAVYG